MFVSLRTQSMPDFRPTESSVYLKTGAKVSIFARTHKRFVNFLMGLKVSISNFSLFKTYKS